MLHHRYESSCLGTMIIIGSGWSNTYIHVHTCTYVYVRIHVRPPTSASSDYLITPKVEKLKRALSHHKDAYNYTTTVQ